MLIRRLLALAISLPLSLADITFAVPGAGATVDPSALTITWTDSGSPALTTYSLFLCAGGNTAGSFVQLVTLKDGGDLSTDSTFSATVQPGVGGSTTNAYFLKMIAAAAGGSATYYSSRFTLSGMTGVFPVTVTTGLQSVSGTSGPANSNQIAQVAGGTDTQVASASFAIPYNMQSGDTRFAPMPPVPSTQITVKAASAQYPASSWTAWTTNHGPPNAVKTITPGVSFSVSSMAATIAAAGQPIDADMQKFLNRWSTYDPFPLRFELPWLTCTAED